MERISEGVKVETTPEKCQLFRLSRNVYLEAERLVEESGVDLGARKRKLLIWLTADSLVRSRLREFNASLDSTPTLSQEPQFRDFTLYVSQSYGEIMDTINESIATQLRGLWQGRPIKDTFTDELLSLRDRAVSLSQNGS